MSLAARLSGLFFVASAGVILVCIYLSFIFFNNREGIYFREVLTLIFKVIQCIYRHFDLVK